MSPNRAARPYRWAWVCLTIVGCATAVGDAPQPAGPEARLAELKIQLPTYVPSKAPIAPLVVVGNLAFLSGHTPSPVDGKVVVGRVGEELDIAAGRDAARQVGLKLLAALRQELGSLDRVRRVVKVLGMVNCPPGFKDQPAVINGCSELFIDVFGKERGTGARSAVGMSSLPGNVCVEIEAIFEIEPAR